MLHTCELLFNHIKDHMDNGDIQGIQVLANALQTCGADEGDCNHKTTCTARLQKLLEDTKALEDA